MNTNFLPLSARYGHVLTTRRIVHSNVVSERCLPYGIGEMTTPEICAQVWKSVVEAEPDFEPDKESVVVFCLNCRMAPFAWHRVSVGTVSDCSCHPREVLRPVIATAAHGFIVMHNHPSGDPSPSRPDEIITRKLIEASALMQILLFDHVIIGKPSPGRSSYFSFREAGIVP
jgi:DNA repair protein RadC